MDAAAADAGPRPHRHHGGPPARQQKLCQKLKALLHPSSKEQHRCPDILQPERAERAVCAANGQAPAEVEGSAAVEVKEEPGVPPVQGSASARLQPGAHTPAAPLAPAAAASPSTRQHPDTPPPALVRAGLCSCCSQLHSGSSWPGSRSCHATAGPAAAAAASHGSRLCRCQ